MHFSACVVVPVGTTYAEAETLVKPLMAPYDENLCTHYEESDGECSCDGQWDWWVIGGRYTGMLSEYDPTQDPLNFERCMICGGSGLRDRTSSPFAGEYTDDQWAEWVKWSGGCNGCQGKGRALSFRLRPFEGDIAPATYAINARVPYTVVCEHGWTGRFEYPQDEEAHYAAVKEHLELHRDEWVVVVDYHS